MSAPSHIQVAAPVTDVTPPPGQPPSGGGGGCASAPGCNCAVQFPDTKKGAVPESLTFTFTNLLNHPITITGVQVQSDHPELWQVDTSQLHGTLQVNEVRTFRVTFTPPGK